MSKEWKILQNLHENVCFKHSNSTFLLLILCDFFLMVFYYRSFPVFLWPWVSSAESLWCLCLIADDVWRLPPSPSPPATGPGSGTVGPFASVWSAWSSAGSESPPDGPGRPPTPAERCPALCPQSEVYPRGWLSLCWSAQRRATTGHLSSVPAGAVRKIKREEQRNCLIEEFIVVRLLKIHKALLETSVFVFVWWQLCVWECTLLQEAFSYICTLLVHDNYIMHKTPQDQYL